LRKSPKKKQWSPSRCSKWEGEDPEEKPRTNGIYKKEWFFFFNPRKKMANRKENRSEIILRSL